MEVYFSDNYDNQSLFLLQVPNSIINEIKDINNDLLIKGSNDRTIFCTNDKNFEIKFLDTTNTFLLLNQYEDDKNINKKKIRLMTFHNLECCDIIPKKYLIYNLLKKYCNLNYNLQTGENNFNTFERKYTIEDCFALSDLPKNQFLKMIEEQNIFLYENKYLCVFNISFSNEIISLILKAMSYKNKDTFSDEEDSFNLLKELDYNYDKVLLNMNKEVKIYLLNFICDVDNFGVSINIEKVKLFIAKNLFFSNYDKDKNYIFKLDQFITLFNNAISIYLPIELVNKYQQNLNEYLIKSDCKDNLYEYYKDYDLRFLKGNCVIFIDKKYNKPLIQWIDKSNLAETFEKRIEQLFNIKDRWTQKDLNIFMEDLQINNLNDRIIRLTQYVIEKNIFDQTKSFNALYLKKNPFFFRK